MEDKEASQVDAATRAEPAPKVELVAVKAAEEVEGSGATAAEGR